MTGGFFSPWIYTDREGWGGDKTGMMEDAEPKKRVGDNALHLHSGKKRRGPATPPYIDHLVSSDFFSAGLFAFSASSLSSFIGVDSLGSLKS